MTQLMTARKLTKSEMQAVQGGFLLSLIAACSESCGPIKSKKLERPEGTCPVKDGGPDEIEECEVQQNPDGSGCDGRKPLF